MVVASGSLGWVVLPSHAGGLVPHRRISLHPPATGLLELRHACLQHHCDALRPAHAASHRRTCRSLRMSSSLPATGLATALTGGLPSVFASLPAFEVLRMRIFILISAVALMWALASIVVNLLGSAWAAVSGRG